MKKNENKKGDGEKKEKGLIVTVNVDGLRGGVTNVKADVNSKKVTLNVVVDPIGIKEKLEKETKKKPDKEKKPGSDNKPEKNPKQVKTSISKLPNDLETKKKPDKEKKPGKEKNSSSDNKPEKNPNQVKTSISKLPNDLETKKKPDKKKHSGSDNKAEKNPNQASVSTAELKVQFQCQCDGCSDKIREIVFATKGVHEWKLDQQKELVTVKGTMDVKALAEALNNKLKKNVEIVRAKKEKAGNIEGGDGKNKKK